MARQTVTISFRVSFGEAEQLDGLARQYKVGSRNDYVRSLIRRHLRGDDREQLELMASLLGEIMDGVERADGEHRAQFERLVEQLRQLRQDVTTATVALLVKTADVSLDEAEDWARKTMFAIDRS